MDGDPRSSVQTVDERLDLIVQTVRGIEERIEERQQHAFEQYTERLLSAVYTFLKSSPSSHGCDNTRAVADAPSAWQDCNGVASGASDSERQLSVGSQTRLNSHRADKAYTNKGAAVHAQLGFRSKKDSTDDAQSWLDAKGQRDAGSGASLLDAQRWLDSNGTHPANAGAPQRLALADARRAKDASRTALELPAIQGSARRGEARILEEALSRESASFKSQVDKMFEAHFQRQSELVRSHFTGEGVVETKQRPGDHQRGCSAIVARGSGSCKKSPRPSGRGHRAQGQDGGKARLQDACEPSTWSSEGRQWSSEGRQGEATAAAAARDNNIAELAQLAQLNGPHAPPSWITASPTKITVHPCKLPLPQAEPSAFEVLKESMTRSQSSNDDFSLSPTRRDSFSRRDSLRVAALVSAAFGYFDWWRTIQEPRREGCLYRLVYSRSLSLTSATVIALNAIFAIIVTDFEATSYLQPQGSVQATQMTLVMMDLFFLIFYIVEIGLKLSVHKLYFFTNGDYQWNIFDLFLVIFNILDFVIFSVSSRAEGHRDSPFMRFFRILKLAKVLRIIRMFRLISELRMMMNSVIGSLGTLFWSVTVIMFVLYMFGIILVQFVTSYYETLESPMEPQVQKLFGSVLKSMLTLYMCATGGIDWSEVYGTVTMMEWKIVVAFLLYMVFTQIAVLNIVTGIFVENAMKLAQPDTHVRARKQQRKHLADAADLRALCKEIDTDGSGTLSVEEFVEAYKTNNKLRAKFTVLGLDVNDAVVFFDMLRVLDEEKEEIDIEIFIGFCLRLQGNATSIDLHHMLLETRLGQKKQHYFNKYVTARLDELADKLR